MKIAPGKPTSRHQLHHTTTPPHCFFVKPFSPSMIFTFRSSRSKEGCLRVVRLVKGSFLKLFSCFFPSSPLFHAATAGSPWLPENRVLQPPLNRMLCNLSWVVSFMTFFFLSRLPDHSFTQKTHGLLPSRRNPLNHGRAPCCRQLSAFSSSPIPSQVSSKTAPWLPLNRRKNKPQKPTLYHLHVATFTTFLARTNYHHVATLLQSHPSREQPPFSRH